MAENIVHIILEHLRAIRSDIADLKLRVGSLQEHVSGMRRDMGLLDRRTADSRSNPP